MTYARSVAAKRDWEPSSASTVSRVLRELYASPSPEEIASRSDTRSLESGCGSETVPNINRVTIAGHLGKDPEVRYTASGTACANLSVATSEKWKDKSTGEKQERTEWHRIVVWGQPAEYVGKYARKGNAVLVEGKIQTRKWQDRDGNDRYSTEIVASSVDILTRSDSGQAEPAREPAGAGGGMDDDIPFGPRLTD